MLAPHHPEWSHGPRHVLARLRRALATNRREADHISSTEAGIAAFLDALPTDLAALLEARLTLVARAVEDIGPDATQAAIRRRASELQRLSS
ncbi:MAG: hypothetical protein U1C74_30985 [Phenylobacterium sp.]|nr:hypothetical protein [Phenylobacterium sp.]